MSRKRKRVPPGLGLFLVAAVVVFGVALAFAQPAPGGYFSLSSSSQNVVFPSVQSYPFCGDCKYSFGESCEDGNTNSNDGCNAQCQVEFCGDGVVQPTETCDKTLSCGSNQYCDVSQCTCATLVSGQRPPFVFLQSTPGFIVRSGIVSHTLIIYDSDKDVVYYQICQSGSNQPNGPLCVGGGGVGGGCTSPTPVTGSGPLYQLTFNTNHILSGSGNVDIVRVIVQDVAGHKNADAVSIPIYP